MYDTLYGIAATFPFDLYDGTTGQLKVDVALATGDAKVSIDNGAAVNVTNLPTVVNGRWVWSATGAELAGKVIRLEIKHAGYLDAVVYVTTRGDARAFRPADGMIFSTTVSAVTANGLTLGAAPSVVPDAALLAELRDATGTVLGVSGASVAGTALTFVPALGSAPAGAATVHLYAAPREVPLSTQTVGAVAGGVTLTAGEKTAVATAVHTELASDLSGIASAASSAATASTAATAAKTAAEATQVAVATLPADVVAAIVAHSDFRKILAYSVGRFTFTKPNLLPGTATLTLYDRDNTTVLMTLSIALDATGQPVTRTGV